jgi:hypothetical protein
MRWKTTRGYQQGDQRTVRYFALWPVNLDDGSTVWLERYYAVEQWQEFESDYLMNYWKVIKTSIDHPYKTAAGSKTKRRK